MSGKLDGKVALVTGASSGIGPALSWLRSMPPLTSEDIAAAIVYAVTQPGQVDVNEMLIQPTEEVI